MEKKIFNKADMIDAISKESGLTKKDSELAYNAFLKATKEALTEGKEVRIVGFGTFKVQERAARQGRNPQRPDEIIEIKACKTVKFSVGKDLKESIQ